MTANNATQTWEITENGMVYTDEKWGMKKSLCKENEKNYSFKLKIHQF